LSRFENGRDRKQLFRLSEALADCVIERHAANAVLKRKAEWAMKRARRASEISGQTEPV